MYELWYKYPGSEWEQIDESDSKEGINFLLQEYRIAYGYDCSLEIRKG